MYLKKVMHLEFWNSISVIFSRCTFCTKHYKQLSCCLTFVIFVHFGVEWPTFRGNYTTNVFDNNIKHLLHFSAPVLAINSASFFILAEIF